MLVGGVPEVPEGPEGPEGPEPPTFQCRLCDDLLFDGWGGLCDL